MRQIIRQTTFAAILLIVGMCHAQTVTLNGSNNSTQGPVSSGTCVLSSVASNELIVLDGDWGNNAVTAPSETFAVTDSASNSYTGVNVSDTLSGGNTSFSYWTVAASAQASLTITMTIGGTGGGTHTMRLGCFRYGSSTGWPSTPVDSNGTSQNTNAFSGGTQVTGTPGTITPSTGDLIHAVAGFAGTLGAASVTVSAGCTERDGGGTSGAGFGSANPPRVTAADNLSSGNTSTTCTFNWTLSSGAVSFAGIIDAFKPNAAGGGSGTANPSDISTSSPAVVASAGRFVSLSDSSTTSPAVEFAAIRAATVTNGIATASTSNATTYVTGSFTPAANDLLAVFVVGSGTTSAGSVTDSLGGTYTKITSALKNASADTVYLFVANQLASGSAMTVTFTTAAATGAVVSVARIAAITSTGASAVLQSQVQANQALSTTPAPAFTTTTLATNVTLGLVGNSTSPATMTPPTGWTEQSDTGYSTPTTGSEYISRNSGFAGTTVTWGNTSATAFGDIIAEFNSHVDYGVAITESSTSSPSVTAAVPPHSASISETSTSAPAISIGDNAAWATPNTVTNTDSVAALLGRGAPIAGASTSSPSVTTITSRQVPISDSSASALSISIQAAHSTSIADSSTTVPGLSTQSGKGAPISDSSTSSVALSAQAAHQAALSETSASSPAVTSSAGRSAPLAVTSTTAPALATQSGKGAPITDTSTSAVALATQSGKGAPITDTSTSSPSIQASASHQKALSDNSTTTPALAAQAGKGVPLSESNTASPAILVDFQLNKSLAQTSTSSDAISVSHSSGQRRRVVIISQLNSYGGTLTNSTTIPN